MSTNASNSVEPEQSNLMGSIIIGFIFIVIFFKSAEYFFDAKLQQRAASFPFVIGLMTDYEWINDDGFCPCGPAVKRDGLNVAYTYSVDNERYFGTRKRFAWRQFGSGSPQAIALAKSWGKGNQVKVFYDPTDPSLAALDNLFTPGDWKTLGLATTGFITSLLVIGFLTWQSFAYYSMPWKSDADALQALGEYPKRPITATSEP